MIDQPYLRACMPDDEWLLPASGPDDEGKFLNARGQEWFMNVRQLCLFAGRNLA